MGVKSSSIPIMTQGDPVTKASLFALLLEVRDLLDNSDMDSVKRELSDAFALSEQEKANRDAYVKLIADGEKTKKSLDAQQKEITEKSIKVASDLEANKAIRLDISAREADLKKDLADLETQKAKADEKDIALITRENQIKTDEAILADKKKSSEQKTAELSILEEKLKDQQANIQSILDKVK